MKTTSHSTLALAALLALGTGAACVGTFGAEGTSGDGPDGSSGSMGTPSPDAAASGTPPGPDAQVGGLDSAGVIDAERTADAAHPREGGSGPVGCKVAGTSDWPTYAHDPERTSASDGCMMGPFTVAFSFAPSEPEGGNLTDIVNAIATSEAVYVKSAANNNGAQTAAIVDKLSPSGAPSWRWSFGDFEEHQWPTFAFGVLLVEEDSFWLVADDTGVGTQVAEYDDWGANTADATHWYLSSDVNSKDSSIGVYVGAYLPDPSSTPFPHTLWLQDQVTIPTCGYLVNNSIAVESGTVFQAGEFTANNASPPLPSGVRSFDGTSGTPLWTQQTLPRSSISVGSGMVFLVEQDSALQLVARKQQDGTIAWAKTLANAASVQAPVLAGGLVIVAQSDGIDAYDPASGQLVWSVPGIDAVQGPFVAMINTYFDSCGGSDALSTPSDTSLVAATGSNTLVVTAKDGVHVLALADGSPVWSGTIPGTTGPLKNPVALGKTLYAIDTGANGGIGQLVALTSM
jgi:hypothetical protein